MTQLLCFFGHHRSASSWTKAVLQAVGNALGWRYATLHNAAMFQHNLARYCQQTSLDLLTFTNAKQIYLSEIPPFLGVHVIRDPRDVLVSAYFSHRNSHPTEQWSELIPHRVELQNCSLHEGLLLELACRREQFEDMLHWQSDERILELKMEALTSDPITQFSRLFEFWGLLDTSTPSQLTRLQWAINRVVRRLEHRLKLEFLPRWNDPIIHPVLLKEVLAVQQFRKKSGGRATGVENQHHHYRLGVAGNWRDYFFPELTAQFKAQHNNLLLKWGYETGEEWSL